jgi:hypothetical protein
MRKNPRQTLAKLATIAAFAAPLMLTPAVAQDETETEDANPTAQERPTAQQRGEEKLAKLIEGREAGEPTKCVYMARGPDSLRIINRTAVIYERGGTIWVNRTRHPDSLDDDDILVLRNLTGRSLCRLDSVTTIDRYNRFFTGNIFLTEFVPYKRVKKTDAS